MAMHSDDSSFAASSICDRLSPRIPRRRIYGECPQIAPASLVMQPNPQGRTATRIWNVVASVAFWAVACLPNTPTDSAHAAGAAAPQKNNAAPIATDVVTLNEKADGYRGIWYMNQPVKSEYRFKYSGGLGTYCDFHQPFAVYRPEVDKTFFCYGGAPADGSRRLLHMVSYFDHKTGTVPRPTLLLDKHTNDAHDNPVMAIDKDGYLWIFSTAHGVSRPAYIHRSRRPYDIDEFERVHATRRDGDRAIPIDNFSYFQIFYAPDTGFRAFFTRYNFPVDRTACFMSSADGVHWSEWKRLAAFERGHYQIGAAGHGKLATMFNMHPRPVGLNARTNLYYMESLDSGQTWRTASGKPLEVPLTAVDNPALVRNYQAEQLLAYNKDLQFDPEGQPVLVYVTSYGFEPGPDNERTLSIAHWTGDKWVFHAVTTTDHNYDSASLSFDADGTWRLLSPTEPGPQPYGTGGEMVVWTSPDQGRTWKREQQLTSASRRNHSYARRPVNAHPDFVALWADGDARQPSISDLYICDAQGRVFRLPRQMTDQTSRPQLVDASNGSGR